MMRVYGGLANYEDADEEDVIYQIELWKGEMEARAIKDKEANDKIEAERRKIDSKKPRKGGA